MPIKGGLAGHSEVPVLTEADVLAMIEGAATMPQDAYRALTGLAGRPTLRSKRRTTRQLARLHEAQVLADRQRAAWTLTPAAQVVRMAFAPSDPKPEPPSPALVGAVTAMLDDMEKPPEERRAALMRHLELASMGWLDAGEGE